MRSITIIAFITMSLSFNLQAQTLVRGSKDYGLGGSSVMWPSDPSSLFINPSLLARIHQGEVLVNTQRFASLPSLSSTYFLPSAGTFGLGISNEPDYSSYALGYGSLFSKYLAAGGSLNYTESTEDLLSLSLGVSLNLPDSLAPNSGFSAGLSVQNIPAIRTSPTGVNIGAAYWLLDDAVRVQTAWGLQNDRSDVHFGTEWKINSMFSLYAGTVSMQSYSAGVGYRSSQLNADISAGQQGVALSFHIVFSEPARNVRQESFNQGLKAYEDERYYDAQAHFKNSVRHDEYFTPAQTLLELSIVRMESIAGSYFHEAKDREESGQYAEAIDLYSRVLRVNPYHSEAASRFNDLKRRLTLKVQYLLALGDSLTVQRDLYNARSAYREVSQLDPENQNVQPRLRDVEAMIVMKEAAVKERVDNLAVRAKEYLARNQLDLARKEYIRILAIDPNNTEVRQSLRSIETLQTTTELFERGQLAFDEGNYAEALSMFTEVLKRDEHHKDAGVYIARTRDALAYQAEQYFKYGLQSYADDNYKTALEFWGKVLVIQPGNNAVLAYMKRAQEKLEALRQLQ